MAELTVDVIIPTYKPDKSFFELVQKLESQTRPVRNIIIMNTEEKYFEQLAYGNRFPDKHHNVRKFHLSKKEFDHGKTRRAGVQKSDADIFVMMTQDAMPVDDRLIEKLVDALQQEKVAAAYARQLAKPDCNEAEHFMRQFNYPEESCVKSLEDLDKLGIKTYFCSDVCCAYNRKIYEELGGFIRHAIFNEDMIYAAKAMKHGYRVAYVADAQVLHSHNYNCSQQFKRNFDIGVSQADHPEVFEGVPSEGEGIRSVKATIAHLKKNNMQKMIPYVILQSGFKYMGYRLGKQYKHLPKRLVLACTSNESYWKQEELRGDIKNIDVSAGYGKTESEQNKI